MLHEPERNEQIQLKVLNNVVALDTPCWQCTESSSLYSSRDDAPSHISDLKGEYKNGTYCDVCQDSRFVLTDAGRAIMQLVHRHSGPSNSCREK